MVNNLVSEAAKSIENSFNLLVKNEVGKLPEEIFKHYFLPYFCGEKSLVNTNILKEWISIAGSPSKEVAILNNIDEELFRVPALMDTNTIDTLSKKDGLSITDIFLNYELQNGLLPIIGSRYLKEAMDNKVSTIIKSSASFEQNVTRWDDIFSRYGKSSKPINESEKSINTDDDDLEY